MVQPQSGIFQTQGPGVAPAPTLASGADEFVGRESGSLLEDTPPHRWIDYSKATGNYEDVQTWRWAKASGVSSIALQNNPTDPDAELQLRAVPTSADECIYWIDTPVEANFTFSAYIKTSPSWADGNCSLLVCGDANPAANYLNVQMWGSSRIKLVPVIGGVSQTPVVESPAVVAVNRLHFVEVEVNQGTLTVYCDNVEMFSYSALDYPGRYLGIRAQSDDVWFEDVRFSPWANRNRIYVDTSAVGSGNIGTYADPYTSWAACVAGAHNLSDHIAGRRYCFKSGVNIGAVMSLGGTVTNAQYMHYGPSESELHAVNAVLTPVNWDGPDVNLEYSFPLASGSINGHTTASKTIVLLENGKRMDGTCYANMRDFWEIWQQAIGTFAARNIVPIAGSLNPGQWAYDITTQRVYMRPSADALPFNAANYEVSHLLDHVISVSNPQDLTIENLRIYGAGDNKACLYQEQGGGNLTVRRVIGHGADRGIVFGAETNNVTNMSGLLVDRCESYDVIWKGVSTTGALPWKGLDAPWFVGCWNHDIAPHLSDIADVEGLMTTPGTDGAVILTLKGSRIGRVSESIPAWLDGLGHPVVLSVDGGNDIHVNGVVGKLTRTVLRVTATEGASPTNLTGGNITAGYFANVLAIECGVPESVDPNTARSNACIELQTVCDRNRDEIEYAPPSLEMSGVVFEYLTDHMGKYAYEAGQHSAGTFCAVTLNQPNKTVGSLTYPRNGGALRAELRNYIVSESQASIIFHYGNESVDDGDYTYDNAGVVGAALVDVHSDRGVVHHTGGNLVYAYRIKCQPCGNQRQSATLGDIVGRADGVSGHSVLGGATVELGTRDANTVASDPLLGADYRPDAGSQAIGRASGGQTPLDLSWRTRTQNTVGALEAD